MNTTTADPEDKLMEIESLAETVYLATSELEREYIGKDKNHSVSFTMLLLLRMIEELRVMVLE